MLFFFDGALLFKSFCFKAILMDKMWTKKPLNTVHPYGKITIKKS